MKAAAAVQQMLEKRMKIRRDRKYQYLAEALDATSPEAVVKSWCAAGILRTVFSEPPSQSTPILYDTYCQAAELEVDVEFDVDGDDDEIAATGATGDGPAAADGRKRRRAPSPPVPAEAERRFVLKPSLGRRKKLNLTREEIIMRHRKELAEKEQAKKKKQQPRGLGTFFKKRRVDDID